MISIVLVFFLLIYIHYRQTHYIIACGVVFNVRQSERSLKIVHNCTSSIWYGLTVWLGANVAFGHKSKSLLFQFTMHMYGIRRVKFVWRCENVPLNLFYFPLFVSISITYIIITTLFGQNLIVGPKRKKNVLSFTSKIDFFLYFRSLGGK